MAEGFGPLLSYVHLAFSYIHLASDVNNSSCMVFAAEALKKQNGFFRQDIYIPQEEFLWERNMDHMLCIFSAR